MQKQLTEEQTKKLGDALAAGRKTEAIKVYREATGLGLKETKDAIERDILPKPFAPTPLGPHSSHLF